MELLARRYDLKNDPGPGVTMSRTKPVPQRVRDKLSQGIPWDQQAEMKPQEIRERDVFPALF